jgi:hypothetical protein
VIPLNIRGEGRSFLIYPYDDLVIVPSAMLILKVLCSHCKSWGLLLPPPSPLSHQLCNISKQQESALHSRAGILRDGMYARKVTERSAFQGWKGGFKAKKSPLQRSYYQLEFVLCSKFAEMLVGKQWVFHDDTYGFPWRFGVFYPCVLLWHRYLRLFYCNVYIHKCTYFSSK